MITLLNYEDGEVFQNFKKSRGNFVYPKKRQM